MLPGSFGDDRDILRRVILTKEVPSLNAMLLELHKTCLEVYHTTKSMNHRIALKRACALMNTFFRRKCVKAKVVSLPDKGRGVYSHYKVGDIIKVIPVRSLLYHPDRGTHVNVQFCEYKPSNPDLGFIFWPKSCLRKVKEDVNVA